MGKRESYEPGTFCWVDLATSDAEGAKAFYGDLFGWEFRDDEIPGGVYSDHGDVVGAVYQQDEHPPHWNNYVSVTSAEETVARAKQLGARVLEEPFDVGGFGRVAVLADPAGAMLCVWEPRSHIGAGRVNDVGCMGWNELQTSDSEAAGNFYGGLFGWEAEPIEDDGRVVYTTIKNAGNQNGGFMPMSGAARRRAFLLAPLLHDLFARRRHGEGARAWRLPCLPGPWISLLARSPSLAIPRAPRSPSSRGRPTSRSAQARRRALKRTSSNRRRRIMRL